MISLSHLNKFILFIIFFTILIFNYALSEEEPVDIWKTQENKNTQNNENDEEKDITIESPILSDDTSNKTIVAIDEDKIGENEQSVIGIFDPE